MNKPSKPFFICYIIMALIILGASGFVGGMIGMLAIVEPKLEHIVAAFVYAILQCPAQYLMWRYVTRRIDDIWPGPMPKSAKPQPAPEPLTSGRSRRPE